MHPTPENTRLTYDDFLHFPDDGMLHELVDGEHYVTPSPNTKHQAVSGNLHFMLRRWLEHHPIGRVFYAPLPDRTAEQRVQFVSTRGRLIDRMAGFFR